MARLWAIILSWALPSAACCMANVTASERAVIAEPPQAGTISRSGPELLGAHALTWTEPDPAAGAQETSHIRNHQTRGDQTCSDRSRYSTRYRVEPDCRNRLNSEQKSPDNSEGLDQTSSIRILEIMEII